MYKHPLIPLPPITGLAYASPISTAIDGSLALSDNYAPRPTPHAPRLPSLVSSSLPPCLSCSPPVSGTSGGAFGGPCGSPHLQLVGTSGSVPVGVAAAVAVAVGDGDAMQCDGDVMPCLYFPRAWTLTATFLNLDYSKYLSTDPVIQPSGSKAEAEPGAEAEAEREKRGGLWKPSIIDYQYPQRNLQFTIIPKLIYVAFMHNFQSFPPNQSINHHALEINTPWTPTPGSYSYVINPSILTCTLLLLLLLF